MMNALFLDRDGVINIEKNYVYKIEEFEFVDGIFETLKIFSSKGYLLIIITNQAGIGRGYYNEEDFNILNNWMLNEFHKNGVNVSKVYYSPYHPEYGIGKYKKNSLCRKPNPGMILAAQKEFNIDLKNSILVGDKESDIETGIRAGVGKLILVRDQCKREEINTKAHLKINSIKDIIDTIKI